MLFLTSTCRNIEAHPHIWIDTKIRFVFIHQSLSYIKLTYIFDEMYSVMICDQVDINNNDKFESSEIAKIKEMILKEIDGDNYFAHLKVNNNDIPVENIEFLTALMDKEERLVLFLNIPCNIAATESNQTVAISIYDEKYYCEIVDPIEEMVFIKGANEIECSLSFQEDTKNAYYYDQFNPIFTIINFKKK